MTKYLADVPEDVWKAFKICCTLQGLKVKDGVLEALAEYIKAHQTEQVKVQFKVIQDKKKNLLTFVYETELRTLLTEIVKAQKREAPRKYMDGLKDRLQDVVKKHPTLPPELADEVLAVFKTIP
jgi:hypothetical protein